MENVGIFPLKRNLGELILVQAWRFHLHVKPRIPPTNYLYIFMLIWESLKNIPINVRRDCTRLIGDNILNLNGLWSFINNQPRTSRQVWSQIIFPQQQVQVRWMLMDGV